MRLENPAFLVGERTEARMREKLITKVGFVVLLAAMAAWGAASSGSAGKTFAIDLTISPAVMDFHAGMDVRDAPGRKIRSAAAETQMRDRKSVV